MALVSNIVVGISAWASSHAYSVGNLVTNSSNVYICAKAGTSAGSGGPTGTSNGITDGSVTWNYVCHVDYTSVSSWEAAIPSTLTQPVVGQVLAVSPIDITTPAFTPWLNLSGHSTTPTNTITLTAFPGYGVAALLAAASNNALAINTNYVLFQAPTTPAGSVNYFEANDPNVIFDGLQFQDLGSSSVSTLIQSNSGASNFTLRNCIIDGYAQAGGAAIVYFNAQGSIYNNLIIDRQPSAQGNPAVSYGSGASNIDMVNNTLFRINTDTTGGGTLVDYGPNSGYLFRNNIFMNSFYPTAGGSTFSASTLDHNVTSSTVAGASIGSGQIDNGNNILNVSPSTEFVNTATDFRLKAGATSLNAGTTDTTDVPGGSDITGRVRVQWDAGPWAYFLPASATRSLSALAANGNVSFTTNSASLTRSFGVLSASGTATLRTLASAQPTIAALRPQILVTSFTNASSTSTFDVVIAKGQAVVEVFASGTNSFDTLSAVVSLGQPNAIVGQADIGDLNATGLITQQISIISILPLSCVATATPVLVMTAVNDIDPSFLIRLGQSNPVTNTATFDVLQASSTVTQFDRANGTATFTYTATGIASPTAAGVNTLATLAAVGSMSQFDPASATVGIVRLSTNSSPALLFLTADPSKFLLADGTGLSLQVDPVITRNLTSNTNQAGLASFDILADVALAINSDVATLVRSFVALSANVTASQQDNATGSGTVVLSCVGQASQRDNATAAAGFITTAVGVMGQANLAHAALSINTYTPVISLSSFTPATATNTFAYAASSIMGQGDVATARATFDVLGIVSTAVLQDVASLVRTLPLTCVASAALQDTVSGTNTLPLTTVATAQQFNRASSVNTLAIQAVSAAQPTGAGAAVSAFNFSCVAQMSSQTFWSATINLPFRAAATVASNTNATGGPGLNYTVRAQLGQANLASATNTLPITCASTAVNARVIQGISNIDLSAAATAIIIPEPIFARNNIDLVCVAQAFQFTGAEALVELDNIVASHARLFPSPIGFVEGDDVVFWSS